MKEEIPYNNPKIHQLAQFASTGIGTARGLASVFNTVLQKDLINRQVLQQISTPTIRDVDLVMLHAVPKGHGFMHIEHPLDKTVRKLFSSYVVAQPKYMHVTNFRDGQLDMVVTEGNASISTQTRTANNLL